MKTTEKAWVQAAVDVEDIDLAKKIAVMARDAGAEWIEVGTPLLFKYGYPAIREIRNAVGPNVKLVADYKFFIARICAQHAKDHGADYLVIDVGYNDDLVRDAVKVSKETGIQLIMHMNVRPDDMQERAQQLEALGAEYLFIHHYADYSIGGEKKVVDCIRAIAEHVHIHVGVTSDDMEEAMDAIDGGASWMIFGVALKQADETECHRWIDAIHNRRG